MQAEANSRAKAGARVLIKRTMYRLGWDRGSARNMTDQQLWQWVREHPQAIADVLSRRYEQAAAKWVEGNNSGDEDKLRECERQSDEMQQECDEILAPLSVSVEYPGLYPTFQTPDREYRFDELPRMMAAVSGL